LYKQIPKQTYLGQIDYSDIAVQYNVRSEGALFFMHVH